MEWTCSLKQPCVCWMFIWLNHRELGEYLELQVCRSRVKINHVSWAILSPLFFLTQQPFDSQVESLDYSLSGWLATTDPERRLLSETIWYKQTYLLCANLTSLFLTWDQSCLDQSELSAALWSRVFILCWSVSQVCWERPGSEAQKEPG